MGNAMLLALIMLTQLNGDPVWVESTQVHVMKLHGSECGPTAKSIVRTGPTTLCVKETTNQICDKVEKFGGKCDR